MNEIITYVCAITALLLMIAAITIIQKTLIKDYDPALEYRKGYLLKPIGEPVDDIDIQVAEERQELRDRLYREYLTYGEIRSK